MPLTRQGKRSSLTGRLAVVAVLAISAWACLLSTTERAGWSWPPAWWGSSPARAAFSEAMSRGDASGAVSWAKVVVDRDPMGRKSASVLGEALWLAGRTERASVAYQLALATGWRDRATQSWALEAALANGDFVQASTHLDALLRVSPQAQISPSLVAAIEREPTGREALALRLAHSPVWSETWTLDSAGLASTNLDNRIETLRIARNLGLKLTSPVAGVATWKVLEVHPDQASEFWQAMRGPGDINGRGVWDANFQSSDLKESRSPFEWSKSTTDDTQIGASREAGNSILSIANLTSTTSSLLETHLALRAGRYELSWNQFPNDFPVQFQIVCRNPDIQLQVEYMSSLPHQRKARLTVPPDCLIQRILLRANNVNSSSHAGSITGLTIQGVGTKF